MPLDNFFDRTFYLRSFWELKFCLWPKRCDYSLRWIWLEFAYRGSWVITGPGDAIIEQRWLSKEEYLWHLLRNDSH